MKDINNDIVRDLIEKWFLVPTNFDDQSNVNNTIELKKLYLSAHKKDYLNNFVIFSLIHFHSHKPPCAGCQTIPCKTLPALQDEKYVLLP